LPVPLSAYALATLEGKLYLFGGWDGNRYVNTVYQYDPGQGEWVAQTPMPTVRGFAGAAVAGSKIYVIGGYDGEKALDVNEVYSPDLDVDGSQAWEVQTSMPQNNYGMGVATFTDVIYLLGGVEESLTAIYEYQLESTGWKKIDIPSDYLLSRFGFVTRGSGIHILGGSRNGEFMVEHRKMDIVYTVVIPVVR
jgi:N-acetylneuraminic acid mutarotase